MRNKLKIAIDVSQVVYGTGSSVYTRNLVQSLLKIDQVNEYVLFGGSLRRSSDIRSFFSSLKGNFVSKILPISPTIGDYLWNKMHILPIETLIGQCDVFHSSDWTQPPSKSFKVTTVHDLSPILMPSYTHPKILEVHHRRLKWVRKEVDQIIVPSNATMNDLINYGVESSRITVIPEAIDLGSWTVKKDAIFKVKNKFKIPKGYLLGVGVSERKNTIRIIEAFQKIRKHINLVLVLVGRPLNIERKNVEDVIFTGHINDHELRAFYHGAMALVYPSVSEGFGLPILEAFASGCPVVTSDRSSLPEVAGDAAILVDPFSVDSIASGIKNILKDRKKWTNRGLDRVKKYNWDITARQTLDVYSKKL